MGQVRDDLSVFRQPGFLVAVAIVLASILIIAVLLIWWAA
jgi:hypothetical protein